MIYQILLNVFSLLPTRELLPVTPTCRHFHSLILRLIHHRLQIADGLDGHVLYLECHHPSARLTAPPLYCTPIGTEGLDSLLFDINDTTRYLGQVKKLGNLFTRFRPECNEPELRVKQRHPAGEPRGPLRRRRGGDLLLRGHPRGEHADRRPRGDGVERDRLTTAREHHSEV